MGAGTGEGLNLTLNAAWVRDGVSRRSASRAAPSGLEGGPSRQAAFRGVAWVSGHLTIELGREADVGPGRERIAAGALKTRFLQVCVGEVSPVKVGAAEVGPAQ